MMEKLWTLALAPLALPVPAVTLGHWMNEMHFCRKWTAVMEGDVPRKSMLWDSRFAFRKLGELRTWQSHAASGD